MVPFVTVVHIIVCVVLIAVVLLQHGKGADVGATFGGGGNTLFGASGADSFLSRFTTFLAAMFMVTSIVLASNAMPSAEVEQESRLFKDAPTAAELSQAAEANEESEAAATDEKADGTIEQVGDEAGGEQADPASDLAQTETREADPGTAAPTAEGQSPEKETPTETIASETEAPAKETTEAKESKTSE